MELGSWISGWRGKGLFILLRVDREIKLQVQGG